MENLRKYGEKPFSIAVLHGGPGVSGEMAPVAKKLSSLSGIIEPFQTATTIDGQVEELKEVLTKHGTLPVTLIGFSWGAWLSFIFAARHPSLIKKVILVASGAFTEEYASVPMETLLRRLDREEKEEAKSLIKILSDANEKNRNNEFAKFGALMSKANAFDPISSGFQIEDLNFQQEIFTNIRKEAAELRKTGELLALGKKIESPIVAIHGEDDPSPYKGVEEPLSQTLKSFDFILLKHCGHKPWIEKDATKEFFRVLEKELN